MLLRELFDQEGKHITFCFGRMNPPTIGHEQVFNTMAKVGGEYLIFLSQTQDKKENPLSYEDKIKFIEEIFPQHASHVVKNRELNTIVKVASYLYEQGYRHATFVAGSDRLDSFKKLLTQYNGVDGKAHGYYKFEVLDFTSSGERDPDSSDISGISASKARSAAAEGNFDEFKKATGAGEVAKEMFVAVRNGLGIKESIRENKMRAKDFIPPSKPRNPVVRQQQTSGAGTHKDKKKASKQGDIKHKGKKFDERQGVSGDEQGIAPNPYVKRIIDRNMEEVRLYLRTGKLDPTGDLFYQMYEYYANDIPKHIRENPRKLARTLTAIIAPMMKRYSSVGMNEQDVAEGDEKFDKMMKSITDKRAVKKQRKADNQQRAQDAFNNMFGGDADFLTRGLNIRKKNVDDDGIGKPHISPSGVKTNMPPSDDDYEINYGKNGLVAKDRKSRGIDIATGTKNVDEISKPTLARYVKAAGKDIEQRASSQSFKSGQAGDKYNKADPTHKDTRREKGIDRALGRLSK